MIGLLRERLANVLIREELCAVGTSSEEVDESEESFVVGFKLRSLRTILAEVPFIVRCCML